MTGVELPSANDSTRSPWPAATAGGLSPAGMVTFLAEAVVCSTSMTYSSSGSSSATDAPSVTSVEMSVPVALAVAALSARSVGGECCASHGGSFLAGSADQVWETTAVAMASGRMSFAPYRWRPLTASSKLSSGRYASVLLTCSA